MHAEIDAPAWRPRDTSPEVWQRVVRAFTDMSVAERAEQMVAMSVATERLAVAGILLREPDADADRVEHLLLERRYGTDLAQRVIRHRRRRD